MTHIGILMGAPLVTESGVLVLQANLLSAAVPLSELILDRHILGSTL